jgi:cyclopropane fatty-acyl-phospholipid synthase-like methyltransferase
MLERLLKNFCDLSPETSIVDLGCGKGRVMVVAAHFGFKKLIGIEFAKELCIEASRNMERTQVAINDIHWKVIHANVLDYPIQPDDAVFFMFNPFDEQTLSLFLDKLERSCNQNPRKTWFIYVSPQHAVTLEKRGYQMAYWKKLMNLEGKILYKD